jgi:hypothetical protein
MVSTSSKSFLLEASDYVYARAVYKDINDPGLSYAAQKGYLVEFLVSEEVLYVGNRTLTDSLFDYDGGGPLPAFGEGGTLYQSGAILQPGLYQFWSASGGIGGGTAEGLASALAIAEFGEVVQVDDREDFRFKFTSTVVPIPAAVWLFGSALTGLGWTLRRRIRQGSSFETRCSAATTS